MRVIVALQQHFSMTPDGSVYPNSVFDYTFWCRYLEVFEHVIVFARVSHVERPNPASVPLKSSGPGVHFFPLPDYLGPLQYWENRRKLKSLAKEVLRGKHACILRIPGAIGTLLWYELIKINQPYGVEVVGDPWDALSPGSVKTILRPILRRKMRWELSRQCQLASVASYVTEYSLQNSYPAGGWTTHYSSIELPADVIIGGDTLNLRIARINRKKGSSEPWYLCYSGSLNQLYKAPDVLIDAVGKCIEQGINLELRIIGDGQFRGELEQRCRDLGIAERVKFLGLLPMGQAIYDQLDQADLYVLPSRQEGLPRSVIEAMARGLPCITSNVGGLPELVESQYMVKPDDAAGLAETITKTISNVEEMKRLVKRSVEIASKYRSDTLQESRVRFYCELRDITQDWLNNHKE